MRKETKKTAVCPFCGLPVDKPRELTTHRPLEMPVGSCDCGAVYAFDATGHNLGTAFVEALVFACNMDWDLAWGLLPEEDYLTGLVEQYDVETHCVIPDGSYEGRRVAGALFFVRLHQDIREVTMEGVRKKLARAVTVPAAPQAEAAEVPPLPGLNKKQVEELVAGNHLEPLLQAAYRDKKILRHLERLLCTGDPLLRYRTADFLGRVAAVIAQREPGAVANLLQGMATSFTYTAASHWGAIDAIGEIIRNAPSRYAGYIAALLHLMNDPALRPQAVRALGRIAQVRPDLITPSFPRLLTCLEDADSRTRGYAAWVLGVLAASEAGRHIGDLAGRLQPLTAEDGKIELYEDGHLIHRTVGEVAGEVLRAVGA